MIHVMARSSHTEELDSLIGTDRSGADKSNGFLFFGQLRNFRGRARR